MGGELRHYGAVPLVLDRGRAYEQRIYHKPRGLWVSVTGEYDWPSWCRSEEFSLDRIEFENTITIAEGANILRLETVAQILDFHEEFRADMAAGLSGYIDWGLVTSKYDGIIIAPYQWSLRMSDIAEWYYSWDVASGCIWNLNVIEVSETLGVAEPSNKR